MVLHSDKGLFGFTKGDYVLLDCKGSGGWSIPEEQMQEAPARQLYNLKEDIEQKNNLSLLQQDKSNKMKAELDRIVESKGSRFL